MSITLIQNHNQNTDPLYQLNGKVTRKKNKEGICNIKVAGFNFKGFEEIITNDPATKAYLATPNSPSSRIILPIHDRRTHSLKHMSVRCQEIADALRMTPKHIRRLTKKSVLELAINANKIPVIPQSLMSKTKRHLSQFDIKKKEYKEIVKFYQKSLPLLLLSNDPIHIKKDKFNLSHTVIYIPDGEYQSGFHIKSKIVLGVGNFNRVSLGLDVIHGRRAAIRSGAKEHVSERELRCNDEYVTIDPNGEFFVTGTAVNHYGSWRSRLENKDECFQCTNVEKVTIVMNEIPDGELFNRIYYPDEHPSGYLRKSERLFIALHLTKGLKLAHQNNLVDLDYKIENVFLDGIVPKMGDFGQVLYDGEIINFPLGSPGNLSPEIVRVILKEESLEVHPSNQMWLHGCVLAHLFRGDAFDEWVDQDEQISEIILDRDQLAKAMDAIFPEHKFVGTIDWCIAQCLQYDPEDRITTEELIPYLKVLLEQSSSKKTNRIGRNFSDITLTVKRI